MTYRDETETLRAQVAKLEGELSAAKHEVERLRGAATDDATGVAAPDRWVGEPLVFDEEHVLPFRITEQGYESIAALLKERLAIEVSQVGSALHGTVRAGVGPRFSLTCEGDTTRIKLRTDVSMLRGGAASGPGLMALFGGLPTLGLMLDLANRGIGTPLHALWAVPMLMLGAGYGTRKLAARRAREGRAQHTGTLAALLDVAAAHRLAQDSAADATRVRVELAAEQEVEVAAAAEAEKEREREA